MRTRVISGIIAILIVIPIIYLGGHVFRAGALFLGLIAIREMLKLRDGYKRVPNGAKIMTYLFAFLMMMNSVKFGDFYIDFNTAFVGIMLIVFMFPIVFYRDIEKYSFNDAAFLYVAVLYVGLPFNAGILLRDSSLHFLIIAALISVLTDTFAYFVGNFIGRHKLIPEISPNKSVEGAIGGAVFAVIGIVIYILSFDTGLTVVQGIVITLILSPIGQVGDLVASAIKRRYKIKDFGNLMPGHGGVLDRMDNLMFVFLGLSIILDMISKISAY